MEEIEIVWKAILAFLKKDNPTMFSIILTILGIAITIFTVVYSFMESTFQKLITLENENKNATEDDPIRSSSLKFSKRYFNVLKGFNSQLKHLIYFNIFLLLLYGVATICTKTEWLQLIYNILSFIFVFLCAFVLIRYIYAYNKRYKI